jgi:hypothetical protein
MVKVRPFGEKRTTGWHALDLCPEGVLQEKEVRDKETDDE